MDQLHVCIWYAAECIQLIGYIDCFTYIIRCKFLQEVYSLPCRQTGCIVWPIHETICTTSIQPNMLIDHTKVPSITQRVMVHKFDGIKKNISAYDSFADVCKCIFLWTLAQPGLYCNYYSVFTWCKQSSSIRQFINCFSSYMFKILSVCVIKNSMLFYYFICVSVV